MGSGKSSILRQFAESRARSAKYRGVGHPPGVVCLLGDDEDFTDGRQETAIDPPVESSAG